MHSCKPESTRKLCSLSVCFYQGLVPFHVSCTSGTTVQGAFDPLYHIADVCEKHKLWMHVDVSHPVEDKSMSVDKPRFS